MPKISDVRNMMEAFHALAPALNDTELQAIALILGSATERLLKEAEDDA